jgi:hypothetical protein
MLTTRLIVRVLDAAGSLLAWAEVHAEARGDGRLWSTHACLAPVEAAGEPAFVSVHWPDVHVEARAPIAYQGVKPGDTVTLPWANQPVMTIGPMPGPLPPVTVRSSVSVAMPPSAMSVVAR